MTVTPVPPTAVPYPEWDPLPRPPRGTALWLALALLLAAGAAGFVQGWDLAESPYSERADACAALDLEPIATALGTPIPPATTLDVPGTTTTPAGRAVRRCSFTANQPDGSPFVRGAVTLEWYPFAAAGEIYYGMTRDQAADSIYELDNIRDVPGLADEAFGYHDSDDQLPSFRIGAVDANLIFDVGVVVSPSNPAWHPGDPDPAYATLAQVIRASLPRLR